MMSKAIVVGALSFVGYSLVEHLLAEDMEVLGLDYDDPQQPVSIHEEKLLGIGRNASFTYAALTGDYPDAMRKHGGTAVYACVAEPNQPSFEQERGRIEEVLRQTVSFCRTYKKKLILLSSVEAAAVRQGVQADATANGAFFYELEELVERELQQYCVIQAPIVYGPWQPSFMLYHQLLRGEAATDREHGEDAVYVEDAAACLYEAGIGDGKGIYHMESGRPRQWERGIELLGGTVPKRGESGREKGTPPYPYRPRLDLQEGLRQQRLHIQQYQHMYERMP